MKIIKENVEILTSISEEEVLKHIELCGRVCYKSEDKITEGSAKTFIENILSRKHEAVLEHFNITVKFICDRGVTHEIVRHRLASYCQESTRYCNYSKEKYNNEITVVEPFYLQKGTSSYDVWENACIASEKAYFDMLNDGCTPQEARAVLPNSLKTELVMTANLREWRHFLKLRTSKAAHPQMRLVAKKLLGKFIELLPTVFGDIVEE